MKWTARHFTRALATLFAPLLILLIAAPVAAEPQPRTDPYPYQSCFEIAARMHDVPVDLLLAVAATESAWDPDARSHANAHGIMQIQWPGTARHLGVKRVSELYNPCLNIELGARYLRELLDASSGNVETALASYNYGPGRISRAEVLPEGARRYAETVASHQSKIGAVSEVRSRELTKSAGLVFESSTRAERFARSLNGKIDHASFTTLPIEGGRHRVSMTVDDAGLSVTDVATLEALGWSEFGDAP